MRNLTLQNVLDFFIDFIEILIIGVTVFILVYLFVGQLLEVSGDSMYPTLYNKEQIIAEKISTKIKPLEHGEIVIFRHPEQTNRLLIKRVIGLPNETIRLVEGQVYINNMLLTEDYVDQKIKTLGNKTIQDNIEYKIPKDSYVLMGDNREESSDSRTFGPVPEGLIVGRALMVYYPLNEIRVIKH